jgi:hypothetical protein
MIELLDLILRTIPGVALAALLVLPFFISDEQPV